MGEYPGDDFEEMDDEQLEEMAADESVSQAVREAVLFTLVSKAIAESFTGIIEEGM